MFKKDRIITLDIGASKLVMAEFLATPSGVPQLLNYGMGQLGAEADGKEDSSAYIVSAMRQIMRKHGIRPAPLLMSISGQAVFPRYVKLPPVSQDKILQMVHYEAEQNVPFPIDEVVWDYQLIGDAGEGEMNVMLVAVKLENVTRLTDCVQAVDLEPEIIDVAPMALYNTVRYNYPDLQGCTMVLDIGARSSNLIFVEEQRIFSRSIPVAGMAITQELMKEFEVSFEEAEDLKLQHAFVAFGGVYAGPENEVADRVSKIVRNVVTRLHSEVSRSVNFYRSQQGGSSPSMVLLTGGSSVIPHMDTFFREKLKVDVEYLNPFVNVMVGEGIDADQIGSDLQVMGEVTGLALRRSLTCPVEMNLIPPQLVSRKAFRKRQPFFALAAVGLVLILLCWWVYFHRMQAMLRARVDLLESRQTALGNVASTLSVVEKENKNVREDLDAVVFLVDQRTRWIEILDAVHARMLNGMWLTAIRPISRSGNVTHVEISGKVFKDKLAETREGTAFEEFRNRLMASNYFVDDAKRTKILKQLPEDFVWTFTIQAELKEPMVVP